MMEGARPQLNNTPRRLVFRLAVMLGFFVSLGLATWLFVPATETQAQTDSDQTSINADRVIEKGEVVNGDVSVTKGNLIVHGTINGDAVAMSGNVEIDGEVTGDASAVVSGNVILKPKAHVKKSVLAFGQVVLGPDTRVDGDVIAVGGKVLRDPKASVGGSISSPAIPKLDDIANKIAGSQTPGEVAPVTSAFGRLMALFAQGIVALVLLVLGALMTALIPARVRLAGATLEAAPGPSIVVGIIVAVLLFPVVGFAGFILAVSVIGIPFVPVLALAVALLMLAGLVTISAVLGRWVFLSTQHSTSQATNSLVLQVVCGMAIVLSTALIPSALRPGVIIGIMMALLYFATCAGIGAVILSRFGTLAPPAHQPVQQQAPVAPYASPQGQQYVAARLAATGIPGQPPADPGQGQATGT